MPVEETNDNKEILEAAARFYVALNAMFEGDLTLMKEVWSHADDVTYMGPDGGFQGRLGRIARYLGTTGGHEAGWRGTRPRDEDHLGHDTALLTIMRMAGTRNAEGKVQEVRIRATNLFRKEDGKWKMIGHHTDTLPYL